MIQPYPIETRGLTKKFGGVEALTALDLRVPRHSIFGFLGPNGAGKSTAIKLLLGLIRPSGGTGAVAGYDIVHESVELRRKVGYLAQEPRFYEHMTARETLRFAARLFYTGPAGLIEARVNESLELTDLAGKADRPVKGFSGGERQRLGIAQSQINHPELLILDEPAAALDPLGRRDVLAIMERLREHCTIFYSTHILEDVQRVSDTVAILNRGRLLAQAPIEELLAGDGQAVYTLAVKGDDTEARRAAAGQPWVLDLTVVPENGHSRWTVRVTSEEAAEAELLSLVLNTGSVRVAEFSRKKFSLEEIFVNMVGGN
ncbi:MAG TPA: ABC transporter ATP-binding protein [Symbiobacteriaceae bacterium]|nr:ABC transporter ATP-binding protein [Symbiobacteriaceae bacterium]